MRRINRSLASLSSKFTQKPLVSIIASSLAVGALGTMPAAVAEVTLEEVVVYGRKKEESLQDAPLVVNVFGGEAIDRYNLNNTEDVSEFTPGLIIGDAVSNSGPVITLRGVQTPPANQAADQSVSFVVDGVALSTSSVARMSQIDVQQVEVLKGPQALFFGKNSSGGILNYVTNDPTDEFEVSVKTGYEFEADESYGQLIVSGPITDTLKGRLVMRYNDMKGWLDTSAPASTAQDIPGVFVGFAPGGSSRGPNTDSMFFRGTLVWEPTDELRMRTKIASDNLNHQGVVGTSQLSSCNAGTSAGVGLANPNDDCDADGKAPQQHLSPEQLVLLGFAPDSDPTNRGDSQQILASHEIKYALSDTWEMTSVTGFFKSQDYYINQLLGGQIGFNAAENPSEQQQISQELRFETSFDGPLNYTFGGFYSDAEFESQTNVTFPVAFGALGGLLTPQDPDREIDTQAWSVFGQVSWDVTDTVNITAGARYSEEDKDFTATDTGRELVFTDKDNRSRSFDDLSPEVTVSWQPEDHLSFFASYKEGFKSGGFNVTLIPLFDSVTAPATAAALMLPPGSIPEATASYDQETVKGFEVGAKTQWLDDRLRINGAIYQYEFTDLQAAFFDTSASTLNIVNAGELTTTGAEVDLTYLSDSIEGLMLTSSVAWNDTEYTDDFIFGCFSGQTPAQGCVGGTQNLKGNEAVNAPELQATFGVVYEFAIADGLNLEVNALTTYSGSFFTQQEEDPRSVQDSHWKYHAGATLRPDDDVWSLSVTGRNLSNEYVCNVTADQIGSVATPADQFCSIQRGRQVWVEAEYRF